MTLVHVIRLHERYISSVCRQRPYHVESTGSRPITEIKQRRARLVLGWVTAWEHRVLLASMFWPFFLFSFFVVVVSDVSPSVQTAWQCDVFFSSVLFFFSFSCCLFLKKEKKKREDRRNRKASHLMPYFVRVPFSRFNFNGCCWQHTTWQQQQRDCDNTEQQQPKLTTCT